MVRRTGSELLLGSGVVAGIVDVGAASAINAVSPVIVLQAIASGVLGGASFHGGNTSAVLGLILQLAMSILIAAVFWLAADRLSFIRRSPVLWGALYGLPVYVVMTFVVVPLSRATPHLPASPQAAIPDLVAMAVFGTIVGIGYALRQRRSSLY